MGASYTNITLKGPTQNEVGDFLDRENIVAYVTPTVGDITVVYDQASASDEAALTVLAERISRSLDCVALTASVYDSDIFQYHLYLSGALTDEYNSCPDYWDDEADTISPPIGGNAEKLCAAFGIIGKLEAVSKILHLYDPDLLNESASSAKAEHDYYVFEDYRHADIADALLLPDYVACAGFQSCGNDIAPNGLSASSMRRTGSAA